MKKVFWVLWMGSIAFGSTGAWAGDLAAIAVTLQGKPGYEVHSSVMEQVLSLNAGLVRRDLVNVFHVYVRSHFGSSVFDHGGTFCLEAKKGISQDIFENEVLLPFFDIRDLVKGVRTIEFSYAVDEECSPMNWLTLMKGPAIKADVSGHEGRPADEAFIREVISLNAQLFGKDLVDDYRVTRRSTAKRSGYSFCLQPRANPPTRVFEGILNMYKKIGPVPSDTRYNLVTVEDCDEIDPQPIYEGSTNRS